MAVPPHTVMACTGQSRAVVVLDNQLPSLQAGWLPQLWLRDTSGSLGCSTPAGWDVGSHWSHSKRWCFYHAVLQGFQEHGWFIMGIPATDKVHTSTINCNWRSRERAGAMGQEATVVEMLANRAVRLHISPVCRNEAGGTLTRSWISEGSGVVQAGPKPNSPERMVHPSCLPQQPAHDSSLTQHTHFKPCAPVLRYKIHIHAITVASPHHAVKGWEWQCGARVTDQHGGKSQPCHWPLAQQQQQTERNLPEKNTWLGLNEEWACKCSNLFIENSRRGRKAARPELIISCRWFTCL